MPDWWRLITVARHLGVSPIELMNAPKVWQQWGWLHLQYESEVNEAAADYHRRNPRA